MTASNDVPNPFEEKAKQQQLIKDKMANVKHKIAIISGKGGVGKTLVTVNLAAALAKGRKGKVGILDADLTGPCVPKMLGLKGHRMELGTDGIMPARGPEEIAVVSMDFLLPDDEAPVIWRGPLKMGAIRQFLGEVAWGDLDYLLIDLPPGTGDESLSVMQLLPELDGVIIVTICPRRPVIATKKVPRVMPRTNARTTIVVWVKRVFKPCKRRTLRYE